MIVARYKVMPEDRITSLADFFYLKEVVVYNANKCAPSHIPSDERTIQLILRFEHKLPSQSKVFENSILASHSNIK